jgi:hypothetical protein
LNNATLHTAHRRASPAFFVVSLCRRGSTQPGVSSDVALAAELLAWRAVAAATGRKVKKGEGVKDSLVPATARSSCRPFLARLRGPE